MSCDGGSTFHGAVQPLVGVLRGISNFPGEDYVKGISLTSAASRNPLLSEAQTAFEGNYGSSPPSTPSNYIPFGDIEFIKLYIPGKIIARAGTLYYCAGV
jgi:hypothetical protein